MNMQAEWKDLQYLYVQYKCVQNRIKIGKRSGQTINYHLQSHYRLQTTEMQ